jgi:hypothetical protein
MDFTPLAPDYGPPPDWQSWPEYQKPVKPKRSRLKMALGGMALAGLLVIGGGATVFAADPSPRPSTSPSTTTPTTPTTPGTNGGTTNPGTMPNGHCTHMNGGSGSGSGTSNGGTTNSGTNGSNT